MKFLREQKLRPGYYEPIADDIIKYLQSLLFQPLIDIIKDNTRLKTALNATTQAIAHALFTGQIQYHDGAFWGQFSAAISRQLRAIGAKFNARNTTYEISENFLPADIMLSVEQARQRAVKIHDAIRRQVDDIQASYTDYDVSLPADKTVNKINQDWQSASRGITIQPVLSDARKTDLAKEYNDNLKLQIRKWTQTAIERLREKVEDNSMQGYRFENLIDNIKAEHDVSVSKARFIARQETALFMAKFRKNRFADAGVQFYQWQARSAGLTRPAHWALHGKYFAYSNPPIVDPSTGRRGNPGEDFNCLPEDSKIEFACGIKKCFRRWYAGELTTVIFESGKTLRATPNHPVLTLMGWKPISLLNEADYVINLSDELIEAAKTNINHSIISIGKIFESMCELFQFITNKGIRSNFHGDGADGNVYIVDTARGLRFGIKTRCIQFLEKLDFARAESFAFCFGGIFKHFCSFIFTNQFESIMSFHCDSFAERFRHPLSSNFLRFTHVSNMDSSFTQPPPNIHSGNANFKSNSKFAFTGLISLDYGFRINIFSAVCKIWESLTNRYYKSCSSKFLREIVRIKANNLGGFFQRHSFSDKLDRVVKVSRENFSGHVFNLQTKHNWYTSNGYIMHNCLCVDKPLLG